MTTFSFVPSTLAATTPSLGAAATYAVLSSTYTNTTAGTTINGDVGFVTGPAVAPQGIHPHYGPASPFSQAGTDQGSALSSLNSQPCTFNFPPGAVNLSTDTTHGPVGVYTSGVYCSTGAMDIGGALSLTGNGTFIFRTDGALTSTAGAIVTLNGASACNIFWTPIQATTLAANTIFAGTIIDAAGITVGANTSWYGMALAFGGTVTTDTATITTCAANIPLSSSSISSVSSAISAQSVSSIQSSSIQSSSILSSSMQSSSSMRSNSSLLGSTSSTASSLPASSAASSRQRVVIAPITYYPDPTSPVAPTIQVPLLPNTGVGPTASNVSWSIIVMGFLILLSFLFVYAQAKRLSSAGH